MNIPSHTGAGSNGGGRSPVYLTVAQCAERLNVSVKTIRRAIARGELKAVRAGRLVRVPEVELDVYVARHLRPVPPSLPPDRGGAPKSASGRRSPRK